MITKSGLGNLRLGGTGSWGGDTNINAGTLTVDGTINAASGKVVNVNSGGKLAGSGTINRSVNLNNGGTISPKGDGANSNIGTLTSNGQTWAGGSTYVWEISSATAAAGTGYDTVNVTGGTIAITATSGNKMTIKVVSHGAVSGWNRNSVWHWTMGTTSTAMAALAGNFQLDVADFLDDNDGDVNSFQVDLDATSKQIRVSYVPEPTPHCCSAGCAPPVCCGGDAGESELGSDNIARGEQGPPICSRRPLILRSPGYPGGASVYSVYPT